MCYVPKDVPILTLAAFLYRPWICLYIHTEPQAMPTSRRSKSKRPRSVRKNFRLDQARLDAAREALGARTETEAIETALDLILFRKELVDGGDALVGTPIAPFDR